MTTMCDEATLARALDELASTKRDLQHVNAALDRVQGELADIKKAMALRDEALRRGLMQAASGVERRG